MPTIDLKAYEIERDALDCVPWKICADLVVIPVSRAGSSLIVAVEDPTNTEALDKLAAYTGLRIEPVLAPRSEIMAKLAHCYRHRDN